DGVDVVAKTVATPDDMHVGSQQDDIVLIEIARGRVGDVERADRRAVGSNGALERAGVGRAAAEAKHRIAVADLVLDRCSVLKPDMRQPRAGPRRGPVFAKQMLRSARNVANDRRVDIAIAEL